MRRLFEFLIPVYDHDVQENLLSDEHFHELSKKSIYALFDAAGFKIIRQELFKVYPLSFYFRGVRPVIRLFFDRIQIYELKPIHSSNGI